MDSDKTYAIKGSLRPYITWAIFAMLFALIYRTYLGAFVLCLWAGYFKAVMDVLQFHFTKSIFADKGNDEYWNPLISWKRKYSDPIKLIRKKWLGFIPVPVAFTDGWHLAHSGFLNCMFLAVSYTAYNGCVINWWVDIIICRALFATSFHAYYSWLFKK